jgi:hypothetical protein
LTVGGTANVAHNINNATHCTFLTQDITTAGTVRLLPLIYVDEATGKAANTDVVTSATVAGEVTCSFLVTAGHSILDIGPVVNGITRNAATEVSPFVTATQLPCRSLHRNVPLVIPTAAATSAAVVVTHRIPTANTIAIVSATSDPTVSTAGGNRPMVVSTTATAAGTLTLQAQTQDNAVSNAGVDTTVTFDVMILARWGSGLHSGIARRHLTGAGANGDDYAAGDRAQTMAAAGTSLASYAALYTNVDGVVVAPGLAVTHNMGGNAGIVLGGLTGAVGAGALGTVLTLSRTTTTVAATLGRADADVNNAAVVALRDRKSVV